MRQCESFTHSHSGEDCLLYSTRPIAESGCRGKCPCRGVRGRGGPGTRDMRRGAGERRHPRKTALLYSARPIAESGCRGKRPCRGVRGRGGPGKRDMRRGAGERRHPRKTALPRTARQRRISRALVITQNKNLPRSVRPGAGPVPLRIKSGFGFTLRSSPGHRPKACRWESACGRAVWRAVPWAGSHTECRFCIRR